MKRCPHCKFLDKVFLPILSREDSTLREYWIWSEIFVHLHGTDICNFKDIK